MPGSPAPQRSGGQQNTREQSDTAPVGLLGQVVREVDGGLDRLIEAESVLQHQPGEIARVDAPEQVVLSEWLLDVVARAESFPSVMRKPPSPIDSGDQDDGNPRA